MKTLKVYEILDIKSAMDSLIENNEKFPMKIGYKICKIERELCEMEDYIFERLFKVIDEEKIRLASMSEEEMVIYQAVMESEMDIDLFGMDKEELFNNNDIKITVDEISALMKLFEEN